MALVVPASYAVDDPSVSPEGATAIAEPVSVSDLGEGLATTDGGLTSLTHESAVAPLGDGSGVQPLAVVTWHRLQGINRYETMGAIAVESYTTANTVILAKGNDFPDALTASALAGVLDAALLLTDADSNTLTSYTRTQIDRLAPSRVIIVGGNESVSSSVERELRDQFGDAAVSRYSGASRYETALDIYRNGLGNWGDTAIIVTARTFADAVSIAPYAYKQKAPIFLANATTKLLDAAAVEAIRQGGFSKVLLIGGSESVADEVKSQLGRTAFDYVRIAGDHRYETSARVANYAVNTGVLSYNNMALATGSNFPDALVGGVMCGKKSAVLLLVDDSLAGHYTIYRNVALSTISLSSVNSGYLLGGISSVSPNLESIITNSTQLSQYEAAVLDLVNVERAKVGVLPLNASAVLQSATNIRAEEISIKFEHVRPNGTSWSTVITEDFGLSFNAAGENIASGYRTPEAVVAAWMGSTGHRENILDTDFTAMGVGYYVDPGTGTPCWAQFFAG
jgi:putative cell wall-binding protein